VETELRENHSDSIADEVSIGPPNNFYNGLYLDLSASATILNDSSSFRSKETDHAASKWSKRLASLRSRFWKREPAKAPGMH
jgi:hypothetical protein